MLSIPINAMNVSLVNTTVHPQGSLEPSGNAKQIAKEALYWVISAIALIGNLIVCLFFCRNRVLLRKPYNVFIFSLAVIDFLTSINLFIVTAFLIARTFEFPANHVAAEFFCRIIYSRCLLFTFGTMSIYVCLCLTLERWFAVVLPAKYRQNVSTKRVAIALVCSLIVGILSTLDNPSYNVVYKPHFPPEKRCSWRARTPNYNRVIASVGFIIKAFIPSVGITVLYLHMWIKMKTDTRVTQTHGSAARKTITRMAFMASLAIIICWVPAQINYYLYKWGKSRADNDFHFYLMVLAFSNSCINPFLYGITSNKYRKGYWDILTMLISPITRCLPKQSYTVTPIGITGDGGHDTLPLPRSYNKQRIQVTSNSRKTGATKTREQLGQLKRESKV